MRTREIQKGRGGQVMLEFVIVSACVLAIAVMLTLLLYTFKEHGGRIIDLIAAY